MCSTPVLVDIPGRNEKVEWCFVVDLWVVKEWLPAIPARCSQSTRRIGKPVKGEWGCLVFGVSQWNLIHFVGCRIIQKRVGAPLAGRATYTFEIRLDFRSPLSRYPACARTLDTCCDICGEAGGAV